MFFSSEVITDDSGTFCEKILKTCHIAKVDAQTPPILPDIRLTFRHLVSKIVL